MSGICDTCRRTTCEYRADDIAVCGLPKTETNLERLFGTPERAAQTMMKIFAMCNKPTIYCAKCPLSKAPACYGNDDGDYDAFLEWMRGDS